MGELLDLLLKFVVWLPRKVRELWVIFEADRNNETRYLNHLINRAQDIGSDWKEGGPRLQIEEVFEPLDLKQDDKRQSLKTVLQTSRRIVIDGPAGAGKSTLVRYIAYVLAQACDPKRKHLSQDLLGIEPLFPVWMELREWDCNQTLTQALRATTPEGVNPDWLAKQIESDRVFILFDGLDEVPDQRQDVVERMVKFSHSYGSHDGATDRGNRILVTSRPTSRYAEGLNFHKYDRCTLLDLTEEQQLSLLQKYYTLWYPDGATAYREAANLYDYVRSHDSLRRLAANPLLLSLIATLHYQGGGLDDVELALQEHTLYRKVLEALICRHHEYECDADLREDWMLALGALALDMQENGRLQIDECRGATILERVGLSDDEARKRLVDARMRYILRQDNPLGPYYFIHSIFQEYLAAYAISQDPEKWRVIQSHLTDENWTGVVAFYAALSGSADRIVQELLQRRSLDSVVMAARCISTAKNAAAQYVAETVAALQDFAYLDGPETRRAVEALCWIQPQGIDLVIQRISTRHGRTPMPVWLASLADPSALYALRERLISCIEEGVVSIRKEESPLLAEALGIIRDPRIGQMVSVHLSGKALAIGKYPVTEQEYGQFVQSTGHVSPSHWIGKTYPLDRANHPVVNVSCGDAEEYCRWLSAKRKTPVRLPTAEEWTKIAQDGDDDRLYPWGTEYHEGYANCRRVAERTVPVGLFPNGQTLSGVADMLGNVWEWTAPRRTRRDREEYVAKGGAYDTVDIVGYGKGVLLEKLLDGGDKKPSVGFRILQEETR